MGISFASPLSSGIFFVRGCEKTTGNETKEGNTARIIPTAGQGVSLIRNTAVQFGTGANSIFNKTGGTLIGNTSEAAIKAFDSIKGTNSLLGKGFGFIDYVSKNTNAFIGLASIYQTLTAEEGEKFRTGVSCAAGWLAMDNAEKLIKNKLFSTGAGSKEGKIGKLILNATKLSKIAVPQARIASLVIESLLFAGTSIGSWIGASKVAEKIYDKITGREEKDKKIEKDAKELETKNPFAESKKAAIASDIKTIEEREAKSKEAQNAKYAKLDQIRQIERIANKS